VDPGRQVVVTESRFYIFQKIYLEFAANVSSSLKIELYATPVSDSAVPLPAYINLIKASWILIDIIACHPQLSFLNSSTHYELQLLSAVSYSLKKKSLNFNYNTNSKL